MALFQKILIMREGKIPEESEVLRT